mgnify:CR=1 FL=1
MSDFSNLNHLSPEIKLLIVNGQSVIEKAYETLADRNCKFDLTSKRQLKGDCRKVEKCIERLANGKVTEKTVKELEHAVVALQTTYTGLVAFFSR